MFHSFRMPRFSAVVMLLGAMAFATVGCVPDGGPSSMPDSPEEAQVRQQAQDFNRTLVEGAVAGAVVGALIGGLLGGGRGALIGGISGLALGSAAGYYVADKKKKYATEEARLQAEIEDVRTENQKAAQALEAQAKVIDKNRERIAELQAATKQNSAMAGELKAQVAKATENRALIAKSIEGLKKHRDEFQNAATEAGAGAGPLNDEITALNKKIADMEAKLSQLDEAIAVSSTS